MNYDAIIVGGGIAGLTSAAYLCKKGHRVLVLEKEAKTGGLVHTYWRNGFAFDGGIRAFENSGILYPMLKELGISMDVVQSTVRVGIEKHWVTLGSKESLMEYGSLLKTIFPGYERDVDQILEEIKQVMRHMDVIYGIDNPLFLGDRMKDPAYLLKTLLPWLIRYQYHIRKAGALQEPVTRYLKRFTESGSLIDMICQHFFAETPTFFALSYFSLYLDYSYPKGGTGVLAEKMTNYIEVLGGHIKTNEQAVEVEPKKGRVKTNQGNVYTCDQIIWAADQKAFYKALPNEGSLSWAGIRSIVEKGMGGDSVLSFFLELDLSPDYFAARCGVHGFYTPKKKGLSNLPSWKELKQRDLNRMYRWIDDYLEHTTYELSCPVLGDATLAPIGKTGLIVSTLFDYHLVTFLKERGEYETFKRYATEKVLRVLDGSAFPGLSKALVYGDCATPLTLENRYGNAHGAITGWAFQNDPMPAVHSFKQIAKSVKTPIENVFQCGQWTFSPSGLPISILTGKLASDEVEKAQKKVKA